MSADFAERFTGRAAAYSKYRPRYPAEILNILKSEIDFDKDKTVADIGSGTGLLSQVFLQNGNTVFGVEPNDDMRSLAEQKLSSFPIFVSVKGTAERTKLTDSSIDLVTVGQAIHWFDRQRTTMEFARILKENGHVCIAYNDRNKDDAFMQGYEAIIGKHARDRASVPAIGDDYLSKFFRDGMYRKFTLRNEQFLDFEGLLGRIASASYMPNVTDKERFQALKNDASLLFKANGQTGRVRLLYDTVILLGQIRN